MTETLNSKILIMLITLLLPLYGCSEKKHTATPPPAPLKGIVVEELKTVSLPETVELVGTVRARTSAVVAARIPGSITALNVREGDRVSKGQLLARLESAENIARATGAGAGTDEAEQALEEAKSRKKLADATFGRFRKLYDEQAVTRQEFEQRQTEKELAHQSVARAEARLRQAREGGRAATAVADYTMVVSPISGVISARQAELGSTVFPAQPLFTVDDTASYQMELSVPESYSSLVKPGKPVKVIIDALQYEMPAKISEVVPAADPASRTFTAKVPVSRQGMKSGMFGRGIVDAGNGRKGITVPGLALFERGGLTAVWAIDMENFARMRLVKPGKSTGDRVEILSGLSVGDRVAVSGIEKIVDGARIEN